MKKILVIGCGGIGSYLSEHIYRLIINGQINPMDTEITVADFDSVEEKNIRYQNFKKTDIFNKKSKIIGDRYFFLELPDKITSENQLEKFDLIVIAADNSKVREIVFNYCLRDNNKTQFIDLRCEGRSVAFFTKDAGKEKLIQSLGTNIDDTGHSCQLEYELENGIVQNGNVIAATIGSQLILNWLRGEKNPKELIMRI
jgi:molybdopterin/thiamine biosynthesis adenylyltransferase